MKIFAGVCMLLGAFLGAGFVSGRELAFYFARFGDNAIFNIFISMVVLFVCIIFFFMLSGYGGGFKDFSKVYFGKADKFVELLLVISMLIICGSMLAGTYTLTQSVNINGTIGVTITLIVVGFVVFGNVKWISKVNVILVPILIGILLCASIPIIDEWGVGNLSFDKGVITGINYVLINMVSLGMFIINIGGMYSSREKWMISLVTCIIIGIVMSIVVLAIMANNSVDNPMPILSLVEDSAVLCILAKISVYFGIFTSLIANMHLVVEFGYKYVNNKLWVVFLTLLVSYILSIIGFEIIVGYVYGIIGIIGLFIIVVVGINFLIKTLHAKSSCREHL